MLSLKTSIKGTPVQFGQSYYHRIPQDIAGYPRIPRGSSLSHVLYIFDKKVHCSYYCIPLHNVCYSTITNDPVYLQFQNGTLIIQEQDSSPMNHATDRCMLFLIFICIRSIIYRSIIYRLGGAVLTSTHNLCLRAKKKRKIMYTTVNPSFTIRIKLG